MNLSLLSWNLGDHIPADRLAGMARRSRFDVLLLAGEPGFLRLSLKVLGDRWRCLTAGSDRKTAVLTCRTDIVARMEFIADDDLLNITRIEAPRCRPLLLAHVHMPDDDDTFLDPTVRYARASEQAWRVQRCLRDVEAGTRIFRSVVAGDLKMDPFHPAVVNERGLGAVMSCSDARRADSLVFGEGRNTLYNPMWGCYGDRTEGPSGTDYQVPVGGATDGWHIYDQVLLRPELMDNLREIRILASDGRNPLVTPTGLPDFAAGIRHLPVYAQLAV